MSAFYNVDQPPFNMGSVARAIAAANNGLLFDIGDMSTMFQDAAGTTTVTAVEQPVGKILDKSGNGNHATQSVTASRPTLSARYNLLTKTEDFSDAVWTNVASGLVGGLYTEAGSAAILRNTTEVQRGGSLTCELLLSRYNCDWCRVIITDTMVFTNQGRVWVNLSTGEIGATGVFGSGIAVIAAASTKLENGDVLVKLSASTTATTSVIGVCTAIGNNNSARADIGSGIGNGGGLYVKRASLVPYGTDLPYQRVNTATDYDTDPRYFPKYLRFDGVDDYLNLPYMWLYANGSASIVCARDAVSQSVDTYIISERSATNANPKYFPSRQLASGGNMDSYISDDTAAVVLDTIGSAFSGASDKVIRPVVDTGNNIKLFKNGALAADDIYARTGTLTLNNTTIGASVSTTTSNYASMKLYGLIITKSALTDAQRRACERHLSRKAGVAL